MLSKPSARAILRLSLISLLVAAFSGAWEVVASQAPGSPLYLGMLPGPVKLLRETAFDLGLVLCVASLLAAELPERVSLRAGVVVLHVGAALLLGAGLYGAWMGMHGVQLRDLRSDALPLFALKHAGSLATFGVLLWLAHKAFTARA